ncbi:MAG: putative addiction module antidote protein [Duodenibacillus sp.]|nr:putative addiction module antidote protein [Duodenibacillus sp.]
MTITTKRFDITNYLTDEDSIQEYFRQVLADGDSEEIVRALGHIARARGMAQLAADTGLGRESLYKTFAEGSHPRFDTILRVSRALGVPLTV